MLTESLSDKTRLNISGLVSLLGLSSMIASRYVDDKLWRHSLFGWGLMAVGGGLYSSNIIYKNMNADDKIRLKVKLTNFCDKFNKYIGSYFI